MAPLVVRRGMLRLALETTILAVGFALVLGGVVHAAPPPTTVTAALKKELVARHGEAHRARLERGIDQVAALWRPEDGDLGAFVREHFLADPAALDATFARLEQSFETIDGHL